MRFIKDNIFATMNGIDRIKNADEPKNIHAANSIPRKYKFNFEGSFNCSRIIGVNLIIRKNAPIYPNISLKIIVILCLCD